MEFLWTKEKWLGQTAAEGDWAAPASTLHRRSWGDFVEWWKNLWEKIKGVFHGGGGGSASSGGGSGLDYLNNPDRRSLENSKEKKRYVRDPLIPTDVFRGGLFGGYLPGPVIPADTEKIFGPGVVDLVEDVVEVFEKVMDDIKCNYAELFQELKEHGLRILEAGARVFETGEVEDADVHILSMIMTVHAILLDHILEHFGGGEDAWAKLRKYFVKFRESYEELTKAADNVSEGAFAATSNSLYGQAINRSSTIDDLILGATYWGSINLMGLVGAAFNDW